MSMDFRRADDGASVRDVVGRIASTGQQLVADQVELLRLEAKAAAEGVVKSLAMWALAVVFAVGTLATASAAAVLLLAELMPTPAAMGIIALVYAAITVALVLGGKQAQQEAGAALASPLSALCDDADDAADPELPT